MKELLIEWYRRLDTLQRHRGVRIALTVLVLVVGGIGLFTVGQKANDLQSQRLELGRVLTSMNVVNGDELAIDLRDSGVIRVAGRDYGGFGRATFGPAIFDDDGSVIAPNELAEELLGPQKPTWIPAFLLKQPSTAWQFSAGVLAWLLLIVWMSMAGIFVLTTLVTALVAAPFWLIGYEPGVLAIGGIGLLSFTFALLSACVLFLFQYPAQPFAVAHTVVREALRLRISAIFIVGLLILLPLVPLQLDESIALRYQIQTAIARSLTITWIMAACMTLFLSCATIAFEIRDRQIWQLMTKPMGRFNYLLGKWIGVMSINLVLLMVAGMSTFLFVQYLRGRPAADALDARAVEQEVLVARVGSYPVFQRPEREQVLDRVNQEIERDAMLKSMIDSGEVSEIDKKRELARDFIQKDMQRQRQIPPGDFKDYVFTGLAPARGLGGDLHLRYQFHSGREDAHETMPVVFEFTEELPVYARQFVPVQSHFLTVPIEAIRDDGTVRLRIYNAGYDGDEIIPGEWTINFDPDGLELLYPVTTFEANFVRAITVIWMKLGFLAVLGVACSTLLSFSVACLLAFTIFTAASITPYLSYSLELYELRELYRVDQAFIIGLGRFIVWALGPFGQVRPTSLLVEGRLVSGLAMLKVGGIIGLWWSGIALTIGWLVLRRRELATYSGQG